MKMNLELISNKLNIPCFKGKIIPQRPNLTNNKIIAFAGIGRPEKFYNSLSELEIKIVKTFDFPDHHYYTKEELQNIIKEAQSLKADIITTSKDFVKIPSQLKSHFKVLEITIQWENTEDLQNFILTQLKIQ